MTPTERQHFLRRIAAIPGPNGTGEPLTDPADIRKCQELNGTHLIGTETTSFGWSKPTRFNVDRLTPLGLEEIGR